MTGLFFSKIKAIFLCKMLYFYTLIDGFVSFVARHVSIHVSRAALKVNKMYYDKIYDKDNYHLLSYHDGGLSWKAILREKG